MTYAERILRLLARWPGLDDDEIARATGVEPRQQVNQICHRLEAQGRIRRARGASGKVRNYLVEGAREERIEAPPTTARESATSIVRPLEITGGYLRTTLLIISCSGEKRYGGIAEGSGGSIVDDLPSDLARRLIDARRAVLRNAALDDRALMPAWQRYTGTLYAAASPALGLAVERGVHVLIVSGGYGVLKAGEPIGTYDAVLRASAWPKGLLQEVLAAYARRHGVRAVRAFVSRTTDYYQVVTRTDWRRAGVEDCVVITPESSSGAMVKAPRAQGEAFTAFLNGTLDARWRSSDGLALQAHQLC